MQHIQFRIIAILGILLTVSVFGCDSSHKSSTTTTTGSSDSGGGNGGGDDLPTTGQDKELAQEDISALANIDAGSLAIYDHTNNNILRKIFGGTTAQDVTNYLNTRVHYIAEKQDVHVAAGNQEVGEVSKILADSTPQTIALNIGTLYWIISEVAGVPAYLTVDGQSSGVPIQDSRIGLVLVGDAYTQLPQVMRQASLIHEARHSDCTGGLAASSLPLLKTAFSTNNAANVQKLAGHCGHMHVICTSGDYAGYAACDSEAYGAYAIGAIYADAMASNASDESSWTQARAFAIDSFSRLTVPRTGDPDMSSEGVVGN